MTEGKRALRMTVKKRMREGKGTALSVDRWGPSATLHFALDDKKGDKRWEFKKVYKKIKKFSFYYLLLKILCYN
jgi:hypothetical protein